MRTTVRLPDPLLDQARREASRRGTTLTALIEEGLRRVLIASAAPKRRRVRIPISKKVGAPYPGVDYRKTSALLDYLDELDRREAAGRAAGRGAERP